MGGKALSELKRRRQRITSGVTVEIVDLLEVVEVMVAQEATEI